MGDQENPIQRFKRERGLTYEQLAAAWGMRPDHLRKLGAGLTRPGPGVAKQIEEKSGGAISASELVFGSPSTDANGAPATPESDAPDDSAAKRAS